MKLILTRHGETVENVEGVTQGHLPGKLTELGIEQAKKLALRLKNEKIDAIYSSDLARAADTAKEIAKFHPSTPVKFTKELRERNWGEFQGKNRKDIFWAKKGDIKNYTEPKNGEKPKDLFKRAKKFLKYLFNKHKKGTILLMGHGGINKSLICVLTRKCPEDMYRLDNFHNTSVTILEIKEDKNHEIICLDCTRHLK